MNFYTSVRQYGNEILVSGYENGKRYYKELEYKPYLFMSINNTEDTRYKTIQGNPVKKKIFSSIKEAKEFIKQHEDVDSFKIYGLTQFSYVYIFDTFKDLKYDTSSIKTVILDIETDVEDGNPDIEKANKKITAITLQYKDIIFTLGYKDYTPTKNEVKYIKCTNEKELLQQFLKIWDSDVYRPDVVTGWNIEFFDIPYIVRRISFVLGNESSKKLSPWKILETKKVINHGKEQDVLSPMGINILDYYHLYKKFTYTQQESYALGHIAMVELGEKKLDYSEYDGLDDLYKRNFQKYIDYNIHDCELVKRLDDKMKLLELVYVFAYDAGINFVDTLTSVRSWDVIIHNYLLSQYKVIPHVKREEQEVSMPVGAFVKDPQTGMFDWVVSFDLTSLYPHLIMGYNIGPDTFRGKLNNTYTIEELLDGKAKELNNYLFDNEVCFTVNSCSYTNKFQGFLAALMEDSFEKRKMYKKKMLELKENRERNNQKNTYLDNEIAKYENLQMAKKIQLNSCYGALANQYFRWYDIDLAESITKSGQLTIRWAEKYINTYLNKLLKTDNKDYVIAVDTDSLYINFADVVKVWNTDKEKTHQLITRLCETKIQPYFDEIYQKLADYMHSYKQCMHMKLEVIADRGIFVAKKRYILNVMSSEGVRYEKPKLKIMGIEAVRSSTPHSCRESIKDALRVILTKTEKDLRDYIEAFREKFYKMPFEDIAFPRSVNGIDKYTSELDIYTKGTPIHVRGALVYNHFLKKMKLDKKHNPIYDKEKIKFCYLTLPNPVHSNIISVPSDLPKQFNLHKYIDYDTQFEKAFLDPIETIVTCINWKIKETHTLEEFFV